MFLLFGKSFLRSNGKGFASSKQASAACPSLRALIALLLISWARTEQAGNFSH